MAALTDKQKKQLRDSYRLWRSDINAWVRDKFSKSLTDGRIRFSSQQRQYFAVLSELVNAKYKQHLDKLRGKTQEFSDRELALCRKYGVSIMAGKGVGKDFITALTMAWFLDCFPDSRVVASGAVAQHLRNVLWAEFDKICSLADPAGEDKDGRPITCLQALFDIQVGRINHKDNPQRWFAEAVTINKHATEAEQAGTVAGRHAEFMMVVVDEAASTPDVVLHKLEETLTFPLNFALMIFNPERINCYAVKTHHDPELMENWELLHWSAEESELVKPEIIEAAAKGGRDSFKFRVSILGLPPLVTANTLIPPDWVYAARGRDISCTEYDPVLAGVDIGGGGDKSVICIRQGGVVKKFLYNNSKNQMDVADWVAITMDSEGVVAAMVDIVGLGRGAYDRLCQMGLNVRPVDARGKALREDEFFNRRSEMYMTMRKQFQDGLVSLPDDAVDLVEELNAMTFDPQKKNQIVSKDKIRTVLGSSPDSSDALALSYAYHDSIFRAAKYDYNKPLARRNYAIVGFFLFFYTYLLNYLLKYVLTFPV